MRRVVVLDSSPLGRVANPRASRENDLCSLWLEELLTNGTLIIVPEIADYEVRRDLLRAGKSESVNILNEFKTTLTYLPITTGTMLKAAELWALARNQGKPTADPQALDGDVILAAQAILLAEPNDELIIATTNVGHLSLFVDARLWEDIDPSG
jgi:predicted nucleic acid-binding protein